MTPVQRLPGNVVKYQPKSVVGLGPNLYASRFVRYELTTLNVKAHGMNLKSECTWDLAGTETEARIQVYRYVISWEPSLAIRCFRYFRLTLMS